MEGSLVSIFFWEKPLKSTVALILINLSFWIVIGQRPLFVLSLILLISYLHRIWIERIRQEILVDPPDHESWVTLSAYDVENGILHATKGLWSGYVSLRARSHAAFSVVSCLFFLGIGKVGAYLNLFTILIILANSSFVIGPLFRRLSSGQDPIDDLLPEDEPELWGTNTPAPESLSPLLSRMPDHQDDSEEEFHFDPKHFDSSSSSTSNSFELISI